MITPSKLEPSLVGKTVVVELSKPGTDDQPDKFWTHVGVLQGYSTKSDATVIRLVGGETILITTANKFAYQLTYFEYMPVYTSSDF